MVDTPNPYSNLQFLSEYITLFHNTKVLEEIMPRKLTKTEELSNIVEETLKYSPEEPDLENINEGLCKVVYDLLDRGGKRWRPVLCMLFGECFGLDLTQTENPSVKAIFFICGMVEIIHNGSLIIDDIEDSSKMRRCEPCSYLKFGTDIAINAGNLMYFIALRLIPKYISNELYKRFTNILHQELLVLHFGQNWDITWHRKDDFFPTQEQYLQMTAYKTGVLPRLGLRLVGVVLGIKDDLLGEIGKFAETIGVAFQIQDDILNLIGEEFAKGKEIFGEDIYEGKKTLMVLHCLKNSARAERLIEILAKKTDNAELIAEGIEIIKESGSIKYAQEIANRIMKDAWEKMKNKLPESEAKSKIEAFTYYLINRNI